MTTGRSPDVVIVGAGIVGAACAYYLSKDRLSVVVLESRFASAGVTGAGMGHIVVMDDSDAQISLTEHSRRLWAELAPELPRDCEDDPCGTLWIAADEEELAIARAKEAAYSRHGIACEILSGAELAAEEPRLRPGLAGALRVGGDRVIYPPNAARWLLERARERGATVREGVEATAIHADSVETTGGRVSAGAVVNAAGPEAARLTQGLPVRPRKGHLVITDRHPGFCRHQLVELGYVKSAHASSAPSVAFNAQPRATGQILLGSSREFAGWDAAVNSRLLAAMIRRGIEYLPDLAQLSAIRVWTGLRPATPDKLPLIGSWAGEDGTGPWIAAGHEGLGITTATGTGQILSALIRGERPTIDAAPFAPDRRMRETLH